MASSNKLFPNLGNIDHDNPYSTQLTVLSLVMVAAVMLIWQACNAGDLTLILLSLAFLVALGVIWALYRRKYNAWEDEK